MMYSWRYLIISNICNASAVSELGKVSDMQITEERLYWSYEQTHYLRSSDRLRSFDTA